MTNKQKWIATAIIILAIIGVICAIKFLPVWAVIMAICTTLFGGFCGWNLKGKRLSSLLE